MTCIRELVQEGTRELRRAGIHNCRQEADWLMGAALNISPTELFVKRDTPVASRHAAVYRSFLRRRCAAEPLQYILGTVEFFGRLFAVGPGVLVPRPETERVTELALTRCSGLGRVCDVCTGSAAIAITVAKELGSDNISVTAIDLSADALQYATRNVELHRASRVHILQADLLTAIRPNVVFDLIVSNPPYVAPDAYSELPRDVKDHEPRQALLAEDKGMALIRGLAVQATRRLAPSAWLVMEIGCDQGAAAAELLEQLGYRHVTVEHDYAGRDRIALAQWKS